MFYAQSTITVTSGRYTFCRYTITVKNMSMLKTYVYSGVFFFVVVCFFVLNSRKKWVKHKRKTFSQIYICFVKSIQKTKHSAKGSAEPLSVSEEHLTDSHVTRASADTVPDFPEVDTARRNHVRLSRPKWTFSKQNKKQNKQKTG